MRRPLPNQGNGAENGGNGSIMDMLQKYKLYLLAGAGLLVVGIAYHLYSKRSSQSKDDSVTEKGVGAISGAEASEKPTLQIEPAVLDQLQQQVMQYRDHIGILQNEIINRDRQLDMIRQQQGQLGPESGFTTMAAQMGMGASALPPGALGQFSGLHGQLPAYAPPMAGGSMQSMGIGQPMPTREPMSQMNNPTSHPLLGNFPTMFPGGQPGPQGQGMGGMPGQGMGGMPGMGNMPGGMGGMMTPQMIASQPIGSAQMGAFSNEPGIPSMPAAGGGGVFGANAQMFNPYQR
jgi:hypothetical protein